jgi:hypothetical protein
MAGVEARDGAVLGVEDLGSERDRARLGDPLEVDVQLDYRCRAVCHRHLDDSTEVRRALLLDHVPDDVLQNVLEITAATLLFLGNGRPRSEKTK